MIKIYEKFGEKLWKKSIQKLFIRKNGIWVENGDFRTKSDPSKQSKFEELEKKNYDQVEFRDFFIFDHSE